MTKSRAALKKEWESFTIFLDKQLKGDKHPEMVLAIRSMLHQMQLEKIKGFRAKDRFDILNAIKNKYQLNSKQEDTLYKLAEKWADVQEDLAIKKENSSKKAEKIAVRTYEQMDRLKHYASLHEGYALFQYQATDLSVDYLSEEGRKLIFGNYPNSRIRNEEERIVGIEDVVQGLKEDAGDLHRYIDIAAIIAKNHQRITGSNFWELSRAIDHLADVIKYANDKSETDPITQAKKRELIKESIQDFKKYVKENTGISLQPFELKQIVDYIQNNKTLDLEDEERLKQKKIISKKQANPVTESVSIQPEREPEDISPSGTVRYFHVEKKPEPAERGEKQFDQIFIPPESEKLREKIKNIHYKLISDIESMKRLTKSENDSTKLQAYQEKLQYHLTELMSKVDRLPFPEQMKQLKEAKHFYEQEAKRIGSRCEAVVKPDKGRLAPNPEELAPQPPKPKIG